jgi:hypothetical protein
VQKAAKAKASLLREESKESQQVLQEEQVMRVTTSKTLLALTLLLGVLVVGQGTAFAKIVHQLEGTFTGADAPGGPLGPLVPSEAVDQSNGDVYVLESNFAGLGQGEIDKFSENGAYAGVQITGAETPQKSFSFGLVNSGITVDNSSGTNSGDVYVSDTENGVVDRFGSEGAYLGQFSGSETPDGSFKPAGIAVDASGNVYVADDEHAVIDKFTPTGKYIPASQISDPHLTQGMASIALDGSGNIYVTNFCVVGGCEISDVIKFDVAGTFLSVFDSGESEGVAVDPASNRVYVTKATQSFLDPEIIEYEPSGQLFYAFSSGLEGFHPGIGVSAASEKIYLTTLGEGHFSILGTGVTVPTVTNGAASGVLETSASLSGTVDPDVLHEGTAATECGFEYGVSTTYGQAVPCSPAVPFSTATDVNASLSGLSPSTTYHFRLKAANANKVISYGEDMTLTTFGPPTVDSESSQKALTKTAIVEARINPFGFDTTCQVQYVEAATFQGSGYANAITVPCADPNLSGGFGDQGSGSTTLTGLHINATYHYRFVATNSGGTTDGMDQTLETFGVESFKVELLDKEGRPYTQAGGHPFKMVVGFALHKSGEAFGAPDAAGNLKDVETELPPGLVGNPTATPRCTHADLQANECSPAAQVGLLEIISGSGNFLEPFYNMIPSTNIPAEFGTNLDGYQDVYITAGVRSGGDYGITADSLRSSTGVSVTAVTATLWGIPADPGHDSERYCYRPVEVGVIQFGPGCSSSGSVVPFLDDPTSCSAETARLRVNTWQAPEESSEAESKLPSFTGCNKMAFTPSISVLPDTTAEDSPSGITVKLQVPQNESNSLEALSVPDLREAVVALPPGVTVNPAAANGLQACSLEEIGLENANVPTCPDSSKIGSVEIESPLLPDTLKGSVYLAEQEKNPFGSLVAIYVTAEADGVLIKVAGESQLDPVTGQLTTTFRNTPQLPFSDFRLHFFGGPRAPLATPKLCGNYRTTSTLTPWSAPESGPAAFQLSSFVINSGPTGGACTNPGFAPGFTAGTTSNQAGGYSPFTFTMTRGDGEQNLGTVSTTLPPGLVGMLATVPLCGEAQANAGTCSSASIIGHVTTGVGAGPDPLFVPEQGKPLNPVYLTGPYKGAPFGLSVVVPAEAGPFNLGENGKPVVVRAAIKVDPLTAQVTVVTDPLPQMLKGVPLDIRSVNVTIDRPEFTINPTSCEKMQIVGNITSGLGAATTVTAPFQVTNCAALSFKPQFAVATSGKTSRQNGASLGAKLTYPKAPFGSSANIKSVKVDLPKQLPSRLTTLQQACTDAVFNQNPAACPANSRVGSASATTPIIAGSFSGPAYFVSHGGAKFPELVIVLSGEGITIQLHGETFINSEGITSSTFRTVPDVPIGTFELSLPEGPFSALAANGNLCKSKLVMPTTFTAQSGNVIHQSTPISVSDCKPAITITRHNVKGKILTITASVPSAGKLTATGNGLSRVVKKASAAGSVTFAMRLSRHEQQLLSKHPARKLTVNVKLLFAPAHGHTLSGGVRVLIG